MRKIGCSLFFFRFIHAMVSWSPIEELAHPGVICHDIATDSKGNSYAVWVREDQNNLILETAFKYFQGKWESPISLSKLLIEKTAPPAMIVDSSDNVHLLWVESDGNNCSLKTAVRSSNEKWSSSETITSGHTVFSEISLAKNSFGRVFAAWNKKFSKAVSIIQTSEKEENNRWSEPIDLTSQGYYGYINIGADDLGNVYAIWTSIQASIVSGDRAYVQTSQRLSSDSWSTPSDVDCPGRFWGYYKRFGMETRIAVNASGDVFGIWRYTLDNILNSICYSQKNTESDWSESKIISGSHYGAKLTLFPDIAVDNLGNAFSAWNKFVPSFFSESISSIEAVHYSRIDGWSTPQVLFESSATIGFPKMAVDHLGNAVVVWNSEATSDFLIQASFFSKNRGWSQPLDVSLNNEVVKISPKVIIDKMRKLHISWLEGPENQRVIKIITAMLD